jgi:predicted aconitase
VFSADDPAVTPPVVIYQAVTWRAGVPIPRAGARLGSVEVQVDETGGVVASRIVSSVSQFYDAILTDSAKAWRYRPTLKDGRAVKYRRVVTMVTGG